MKSRHLSLMKPLVLVKRHPYEEPYLLQIEFTVSNGSFSGNTDIYCHTEALKEIGNGLREFPKVSNDEYIFEYGSDDPKENLYCHFVLRAYTIDSVGHAAIQFVISNNSEEPYEGKCRFSIQADAASINRLGEKFLRFSKLNELEFEWSPRLDEFV